MADTDKVTAFQARSLAVAQSFIQSVVVFDDLASMDEVNEVSATPLKPPTFAQKARPDKEGDSDAYTGVTLDAKRVVDAFAEIGVVCAILKPGPEEDYGSMLPAAAASSDVLVLDWKIGDSYGDVTLELMRRVIGRDEASGRLRLIVIYTGEPGLAGIAKKVAATIGDFYKEEPLIYEGDFCMRKGPLSAIVLAKANTGLSDDAEIAKLSVGEGELATRLTQEFARMGSGFLRNVALSGLTDVRKHVYVLLSKFDRELDAAYLGHRILLPNPCDAEDHVVEALGAEILSVLEGARPGKNAGAKPIREWLEERIAEGLNLEQPGGKFWKTDDAVSGLTELLDEGREGMDEDRRPNSAKWKLVEKHATQIFTETESEAIIANNRFATLLGQKSRYQQLDPLLTLGTIICGPKEEDKDVEYLLCIQPRCDSVRLKSPTAFPLLPLKTRRAGEKFSLLVEDTRTKEWVRLDYDPKPRQLRLIIFEPGEYPPGEVRGNGSEEGRTFRDKEGKVYRWIAEIRDEHALAVVSKVGNSLSRPGINYAEWHRRSMASG